MCSILVKAKNVFKCFNVLYNGFREKEGEIPEWGIVELQGDLDVRGDTTLDGKFIGDLHYTKTGQPVSMLCWYYIIEMTKKDYVK